MKEMYLMYWLQQCNNSIFQAEVIFQDPLKQSSFVDSSLLVKPTCLLYTLVSIQ